MVALTSCSSPKVLAGEIDLGFGFTVNPCKVEMSSGKLDITVKNKTNENKTLLIATDGASTIKEIAVEANSSKIFTATLDKDRKTEARVTVTDSTNYINHALVVRILIKGGDDK